MPFHVRLDPSRTGQRSTFHQVDGRGPTMRHGLFFHLLEVIGSKYGQHALEGNDGKAWYDHGPWKGTSRDRRFIPFRSWIDNNKKAPVSGGFQAKGGFRLLEVEVQAENGGTAHTGIDTEVAELIVLAIIRRTFNGRGNDLVTIP